MKKDSVIQFVGFITNLEFSDFVPQWEEYAKQFMKVPGAKITQRKSDAKNTFKYVSQHELPEGGFHFNFMKGRNSEHFPEQRVKVVQAGGYLAAEMGSKLHEIKGCVKTMAFISHDENDIDFYRQLTGYRYLNIYQAYYENCTYGHILEFFSAPAQAQVLLEQLQARPGCEAGFYKDCAVPSARMASAGLQARAAHQ